MGKICCILFSGDVNTVSIRVSHAGNHLLMAHRLQRWRRPRASFYLVVMQEQLLELSLLSTLARLWPYPFEDLLLLSLFRNLLASPFSLPSVKPCPFPSRLRHTTIDTMPSFLTDIRAIISRHLLPQGSEFHRPTHSHYRACIVANFECPAAS